VEIPPNLAVTLAAHCLRAHDNRLGAFVFATRTPRPINQREGEPKLRHAQAREEVVRST
jgi:hypothetical protein